MLKHARQNGFSPASILLVVVIVGAIGFTGYAVFKHKNANSNSSSTTATTTTTTKPGTTDSVDQLTQQDASNEASIDSKHESSEKTTSQSADNAAKDLGGAYNETSL